MKRHSWARDAAAVAYLRRQAPRRADGAELLARAEALEAKLAGAKRCRTCGCPLTLAASVRRGQGQRCYDAERSRTAS